MSWPQHFRLPSSSPSAGIPLIAYALDMGAQARELTGSPHHV